MKKKQIALHGVCGIPLVIKHLQCKCVNEFCTKKFRTHPVKKYLSQPKILDKLTPNDTEVKRVQILLRQLATVSDNKKIKSKTEENVESLNSASESLVAKIASTNLTYGEFLNIEAAYEDAKTARNGSEVNHERKRQLNGNTTI